MATATGSIPVAFHVLFAQGAHGITEGDVSDTQIAGQMDVLNAAFLASGFTGFLTT